MVSVLKKQFWGVQDTGDDCLKEDDDRSATHIFADGVEFMRRIKVFSLDNASSYECGIVLQ